MSGDILPFVKVSQKQLLGPDQLSDDKLLAIAKKDDLLDFLGLDQFRGIERAGKWRQIQLEKHEEFCEEQSRIGPTVHEVKTSKPSL